MTQWYWFLSRGTGVATMVLLTATFVLGLVTAGRDRPHGPSQTVVQSLHRTLSLGLTAFLALHVTTAIVDGYTSLTWLDAVVPFVSGYERLWVGLGTLTLDLVAAVVVTSLLRHRLRERTWRWVHLTAYLLWPLSVVHALGLSTSDQPLLRGTTIACAAIGLGAAGWRALSTTPDERLRAAIASQEWS